jgi:hypothetical protein
MFETTLYKDNVSGVFSNTIERNVSVELMTAGDIAWHIVRLQNAQRNRATDRKLRWTATELVRAGESTRTAD